MSNIISRCRHFVGLGARRPRHFGQRPAPDPQGSVARHGDTIAQTTIATCKAQGYNVSAHVLGREGQVIVAVRNGTPASPPSKTP